MIRHLHAFRALSESLEALGHARTVTNALLQRVCSAFAEMVANVTGQRVTVLIGNAVIARDGK